MDTNAVDMHLVQRPRPGLSALSTRSQSSIPSVIWVIGIMFCCSLTTALLRGSWQPRSSFATASALGSTGTVRGFVSGATRFPHVQQPRADGRMARAHVLRNVPMKVTPVLQYPSSSAPSTSALSRPRGAVVNTAQSPPLPSLALALWCALVLGAVRWYRGAPVCAPTPLQPYAMVSLSGNEADSKTPATETTAGTNDNPVAAKPSTVEERFVAAVKGAINSAKDKDAAAAQQYFSDAVALSGDLVKSWATPDNFRYGWEWTTVGFQTLASDMARGGRHKPSAQCLLWFSALVTNTVPFTFLLVPLLRAALGPERDSLWLPTAFTSRRIAAAQRLQARKRSAESG